MHEERSGLLDTFFSLHRAGIFFAFTAAANRISILETSPPDFFSLSLDPSIRRNKVRKKNERTRRTSRIIHILVSVARFLLLSIILCNFLMLGELALSWQYIFDSASCTNYTRAHDEFTFLDL